MKQPEGFEIAAKEDHMCLLKKFLYGLKQSPRQWYKKFDSFMVNLNFSRSNYDSCVYLKKLDGGDYIYLLLYMDHILIVTTNMGEIKKLKEQLGMVFEMIDLEAAKKILGMEIIRDQSNRKLFLSQKEFARKVIRWFGTEKENVISTPLAAHFKLSVALSLTSDGERSCMEKVPYSSAVGSLMYLMVCTRPDIAQAVSVVSRYLSCAGKGHWEAMK
jgi:Reverse transcriptase (RNA-dependent DNA polymerase)